MVLLVVVFFFFFWRVSPGYGMLFFFFFTLRSMRQSSTTQLRMLYKHPLILRETQENDIWFIPEKSKEWKVGWRACGRRREACKLGSDDTPTSNKSKVYVLVDKIWNMYEKIRETQDALMLMQHSTTHLRHILYPPLAIAWKLKH